MENAFVVIQVFVSSALSDAFDLKERTGSELGFESISWVGDEECTDATRDQACGECRMYFPQERFSNLLLASSQIEITRKCIKERINQID